jgi:hypothetical protein
VADVALEVLLGVVAVYGGRKEGICSAALMYFEKSSFHVPLSPLTNGRRTRGTTNARFSTRSRTTVEDEDRLEAVLFLDLPEQFREGSPQRRQRQYR